jgi:hypothetical protein
MFGSHIVAKGTTMGLVGSKYVLALLPKVLVCYMMFGHATIPIFKNPKNGYCKANATPPTYILQNSSLKKNFEAQEQSNQSHPPSSSVQITSQHGCLSFSQPFFFGLAIIIKKLNYKL